MILWTLFQTSDDISRYKKMLFAQGPSPNKLFLSRFVLWVMLYIIMDVKFFVLVFNIGLIFEGNVQLL